MRAADPETLVGRSEELADLGGALVSAAAGTGAVRLLVGEPGIGKTRLADEVGARAAALGFRVAWGRCWEAGGAPPLWPWIELLRGLGAEAALGEAAGAEAARFHTWAAVADALRELSARDPALLVLDDLHAADEASLDLLAFVSRQLRGMRVVLLGTARDAESRRLPAIEERLARVAREGRRLDLARLGPGEVARLAEHVARRALPEALVARVYRASEGNPLFVDEMVRLLAQREALGDAELPLPGNVRAVLAGRLALLAQPSLRVLEAASVLGREFDLAALEALVPGDAGLVEALERASAASGLVAPVPGRAGRHAFSHLLVREALHQALPPARRAGLHHACSLWLERVPGTPPAEIAHHALLGLPHGSVARAVALAREAAARASSMGAYDAAASFLARALDALGPSRDPALRCEVGIALAEAEARAGLADRAGETARVAADVARALGDPVRRARAVLAMGFTTTLGVVNAGLVRALREALLALGDRDAGLSAQLTARLASALQPALDPDEPIALALRAVELARSAGEDATLLSTLYAACSALGDLAGPEVREPLDAECAVLAANLGDLAVEQRARARHAIDLVELGRLAEADRAIAEVERLGEALGLPHYRWRPPIFRSMRALMAGRFADSDRFIEEAARQTEAAGGFDADVSMILHRLGAAIVRGVGTPVEHETTARRLQERLAYGEIVFGCMAVAGAARLGEVEALRASPIVRSGFGGVLEVAPLGDMQLAAALCEGFAAAASAERCAELLARTSQRAEREVTWGMMGLVDMGPFSGFLAELAAAAGRTGEALALFERALARCAERGLAAAEVGLRAERATLLGWLGRPAEAAAERARAEELAGTLGMRPTRVLETRAALGLARPGEEAGPRPAATPPAPLALALVREGDVWSVRHGASTFRIRHRRGVEMLAVLVANPEKPFHCTELDLSGEGAGAAAQAGDAGEVIDSRARDAYRRRAEELEAELAEAEEFHDEGRRARARAELEALAEELARGVGLGGRGRRAGSQAERSRVNVQRRLRDAIQRISEQDAVLGRHLERAVRTGTFCVYRP